MAKDSITASVIAGLVAGAVLITIFSLTMHLNVNIQVPSQGYDPRYQWLVDKTANLTQVKVFLAKYPNIKPTISFGNNGIEAVPEVEYNGPVRSVMNFNSSAIFVSVLERLGIQYTQSGKYITMHLTCQYIDFEPFHANGGFDNYNDQLITQWINNEICYRDPPYHWH